MKYAFIGFGELGKQFLNILSPTDADQIVIFDDTINSSHFQKFPFDYWRNKEFSDYSFLIALGYKHLNLKRIIISNLLQLGRSIHTCIHDSAYICRSAKIGSGVMIYPMANIDFEAIIFDGVLINNSVIVSHETTIGSCSYISPGVVFSGKVTVGENCFIGSGSVIANNVTIGNNVFIGVGSVVTKDIPDNMHAIGNPLKMLGKPLNIK
jgi:sugar O-acyltransferase (sialic acid O-acetyltransferase NeuD family)